MSILESDLLEKVIDRLQLAKDFSNADFWLVGVLSAIEDSFENHMDLFTYANGLIRLKAINVDVKRDILIRYYVSKNWGKTMDGVLSFAKDVEASNYESKLKTALKAIEEKLPQYKGIDSILFYYIGKVYSYRNADIMEHDLLEFTELLSKSNTLNVSGKVKLAADFISSKTMIHEKAEEDMKKSLTNKPSPPKKKGDDYEEEKLNEGPKHTLQDNPYSNASKVQEIPNIECVVCLQQRPDTVQTLDSCKHQFHTKCIANFVEKRLHEGNPVVCPVCKAGIEYKEMMGILEKAGYINNEGGEQEQNTSSNTNEQTQEGEMCKNCGKVHPPNHQHEMTHMDALMAVFSRMGLPIQIIQPRMMAHQQQQQQQQLQGSGQKRVGLWECPQCDTVGQVEEGNMKFECKKCGQLQCLKCKNEWHDGFTCEELLAMLGES
jgi:hypothetical protein